MKRNIKVLLIALVVLALAGGTFAFAATNHVNAGNVGYGESLISGYEVTNIAYTPGADMDTVTAINFTLDKPATIVNIETSNTGWETWTCDPTINYAAELPHAFVDTTVTCSGDVSTEDITLLNVYASSTLELQATPAP